jgi:hypothetical protein
MGAFALKDRKRPLAIMGQVGQADPVYSGRQGPSPDPPNQPGNIQQQIFLAQAL